VVSVVAFASLGLLARLASGPGPQLRMPARLRVGVVIIGAALAAAMACAAALPMLTELKLRSSQDAALRGDGRAATNDALDAHDLEPWAASPYLQLALVYDRAGRLAAARSAIDAATRRDPRDWRLWLVSARVAAERGAVGAARSRLERARELNPRSPGWSR
jgi:Flp pilus assembly protein TadD